MWIGRGFLELVWPGGAGRCVGVLQINGTTGHIVGI